MIEKKGEESKRSSAVDTGATHTHTHTKKKLSNILQANESSKVTSFKDKVSCVTEMEACFMDLWKYSSTSTYCHLSFLPLSSLHPAPPLILHNPVNSHP